MSHRSSGHITEMSRQHSTSSLTNQVRLLIQNIPRNFASLEGYRPTLIIHTCNGTMMRMLALPREDQKKDVTPVACKRCRSLLNFSSRLRLSSVSPSLGATTSCRLAKVLTSTPQSFSEVERFPRKTSETQMILHEFRGFVILTSRPCVQDRNKDSRTRDLGLSWNRHSRERRETSRIQFCEGSQIPMIPSRCPVL